MASASYQTRRDEIETYFDRTAADAWAALTSDAPVSRIRRTVRHGRDAMRQTLMSWLPEDMTGSTLIDAAVALARWPSRRHSVVPKWSPWTCRPRWSIWPESGCAI